MPSSAAAQGGLFGRIKAKVQDRVNAATDSATDAMIDKATGAVICAATNVSCIKKAFGAGKHVEIVDQSGKPVSADDSASAVAKAGGVPANVAAAGDTAAASEPATPTAFVNYDFVPGDRVLFTEDFSADKVGDLPSRVQILSGNWEIADVGGQRMLRSTSGGRVMVPLPAPLPDKFTVELQVIHSWGWNTEVHFADADHSDGLDYASFGSTAGIGAFNSSPAEDKSGKLYTARIMADGGHVKVYQDGKRVANVPHANLGRTNGIWIDGPGSDDAPFYIVSIRVAASDRSLFDALNADGRVSTQGILFGTGSDAIRPESAPTLEEIGTMLRQHADLKLTIEGHTDNVGAAAANQALSERRAAAVRQYLIAHFQIDGARLTSKGYGDTKPAASNDTPEGRQQNRRVELVKN
ncbi:MAG: OmpA family protein [Gemmatimonadota bacterium]|nr:OmpA family protein [Gemmatimonadota bacterium]